MKNFKIILFFFIAAVNLFANNYNIKHILVLHSYNSSMNWEQNIDKAINDTLSPEKNNYIIYREYMDTKRVYTKEYINRLRKFYKEKYKDIHFDLILSSDNNAFDFLKTYRDEIFGDIPVVFCGVNDFKPSDLDDVKHFSGIAENFAAKQTVELAKNLYPKVKKIFVINDYLKTGRAWEREIKKQLKNINLLVEYNKNLDIKELRQKLRSLSGDTIILLGVYFKDKYNHYYTYEKIGKMISKSSAKAPVFALLRFNVAGGVVGGDIIDGYTQGKLMSQMALKVLSGVDIDDIPVKTTRVTRVILDAQEIKRFKMRLDKIPKNAIILNKNIIKHKLNLTPKEQEYLKKKKVLKLCIDPNWMPYEEFNEDGNYVGITADVMKIIQDKLHIKFEPQKVKTWEESIELGKKRKCDLFSLVMPTPNRKKYLKFTSPYLNIPLAVATKNSIMFIEEDMKQLFGKRVGIVKSYAYNELLRKKYPKLQIVDVKDINDGLDKVAKGELYAYIGTLSSIGYQIQKRYLGELKVSGVLDEKWSLGVGVRNDDPTLFNILQKSINSINKKEIEHIVNRWISVKVDKVINYQYLKEVGIVVLIFIIFTIFWFRKLTKLNKKLREQQQFAENQAIFLNTLLDSLPIPIFYKDTNGVYKGTNDEFDSMYGFDKDYLIGKTVYDIANYDMAKKYDEQDKELFKTPNKKQIYHYKIKNHKTGKIHEVVFHKQCYRDTNGNILGLIGAIVDVTDINKIQKNLKKTQNKIRREKESFEFLFNNTIEAIVIFKDGKITDINEAGVKLLGFSSKNKALGKDLFDLIDKDYMEVVKKHIKQSNKEIYEIKALRDDGKVFPALVRGINREVDGKVYRISGIIDITELKEKEKELEKAKLKAEEATRVKAQFLANMSHELRTPMNAILGMSHLILQTSLENKQRRYLQSIDYNAKRLLEIINDILDFSKLEAKKLKLQKESFDLSKILSNIKMLMESKAKEKGLDFTIEIENIKNMILFGDPFRLEQVLINLVNNAIKFTQRGEVKLHIKLLKDDLCHFIVEDSGIGIKTEDQKKLFSPFTQADTTNIKKYGGTGLGLSISNELIKLMGGKIWIESKYGEGSSFIFEIRLPPGDPNNISKQENIVKEEKIGYHQKNENISPKEFDNNEYKKLLEDLKNAILSSKPKECEAVLKKIDEYKLSKNSKIVLDTIKKLLSRYRFKDAYKVLEQMI